MKELFFRFAAWFNLFPCPLCRTAQDRQPFDG